MGATLASPKTREFPSPSPDALPTSPTPASTEPGPKWKRGRSRGRVNHAAGATYAEAWSGKSRGPAGSVDTD